MVTARYRKESLQDVPIAITTVSADQIAALGGAFTLKQLQNTIPSLQIEGFSERNQTITIRGSRSDLLGHDVIRVSSFTRHWLQIHNP